VVGTINVHLAAADRADGGTAHHLLDARRPRGHAHGVVDRCVSSVLTAVDLVTV
jgi:hypothetical protein